MVFHLSVKTTDVMNFAGKIDESEENCKKGPSPEIKQYICFVICACQKFKLLGSFVYIGVRC